MKVSADMHIEGDINDEDILHLRLDITFNKSFFWRIITAFYDTGQKRLSDGGDG